MVNISRQDNDYDADEARVTVVCPWCHDILCWTKGNVHWVNRLQSSVQAVTAIVNILNYLSSMEYVGQIVAG